MFCLVEIILTCINMLGESVDVENFEMLQDLTFPTKISFALPQRVCQCLAHWGTDSVVTFFDRTMLSRTHSNPCTPNQEGPRKLYHLHQQTQVPNLQSYHDSTTCDQCDYGASTHINNLVINDSHKFHIINYFIFKHQYTSSYTFFVGLMTLYLCHSKAASATTNKMVNSIIAPSIPSLY